MVLKIVQANSYSLRWGNVPDGDIFLLGLIINGHVGWLIDFSWLQNQHLRNRKRKGQAARAHSFPCTWTSDHTGKRRRLVVPWVASTMMSIQKLSFSRRGECSTVCFLNLWIRCRFCTTDRKYLRQRTAQKTKRRFFLHYCGNNCFFPSDACADNKLFLCTRAAA